MATVLSWLLRSLYRCGDLLETARRATAGVLALCAALFALRLLCTGNVASENLVSTIFLMLCSLALGVWCLKLYVPLIAALRFLRR